MTSESGQELHSFDPATLEYSLVADIYPGSSSSFPAVWGGVVITQQGFYFTAITPTGAKLMQLEVVDGQEEITELVPIYKGDVSSHAGMYGGITELGDKVYFTTIRGINTGYSLSVFDPSTKIVSRATDAIEPWYVDYGRLVAWNDRLFFPASSPETGDELYEYDSRTNEFNLAIDIWDGAESSSPGDIGGLTQVGDMLYFSARDPMHGVELREFNMATGEYRLVADINPGPESSNPGGATELYWYDGALYFPATDSSGSGLYLYLSLIHI